MESGHRAARIPTGAWWAVGRGVSAGDRARPGSYSWIVRVYSKDDRGSDELAGCGIVIDDRRIPTCAHVADRFDEGCGWARDAEVPVAFPKDDEGFSGVNDCPLKSASIRAESAICAV